MSLFGSFCSGLQPNYVLQTDEHRAGLLARYGPEKLFQAERNFNAAQDLDVSVLEGDIVGVIKQQDPMGSQNRWLIDNGGGYWLSCQPVSNRFCFSLMWKGIVCILIF